MRDDRGKVCMGVYGIVSYDIAVLHEQKNGVDVLGADGKPKMKARSGVSTIPSKLLGLGWLRTSKSEYMGDYARYDEVMALLRKHLTHPRDVVFPALPFAEDAESKVKFWVRRATEKFFDEVISSMRLSTENFMERLDVEGEDALGVGDVAGRVEEVVERAGEKMESFMIALATFRLSEEFKDFKEAKVKEVDLLHDEAILALAKKCAEMDRAKKTNELVAKTA
jgi:hypothetical protein